MNRSRLDLRVLRHAPRHPRRHRLRLCAMVLVLAAPSGAQSTQPVGLRAPAVAPAQTPAVTRPAASGTTVDHAVLDLLLRQHVADGLVDYDAFRNNADFARYLASLNTVKPDALDDNERLAFWLNVYNAYTIDLIASHNERQSIRNLFPTLGFLRLKGPWSQPIVKAAGRTLTLDDVEHNILRKEFHDPRIHFALSFAARGGAPLRSEAYTGSKLDAQLEDQAARFIRQSPAQNRVEAKMRTVYLSPIFMNYRDDFGGSMQAIAKLLARYYPDDPEHALLGRPFFRVQQTRFDWSLNSRDSAKVTR